MLWTVLGIGAALRLWQYHAFSFSNDELSALSRLGYDSMRDLVMGGVRPDGHPAAAQVVLWYLTRWFGDGEAMVRLPFVFAGIGAVWYAFRMGRAWVGISAGLLVAAAMASLEFPLLYSRIARPYALGLFLSTVTAYHWIRVMRGTHSSWNLSMLALSLALCAYTHYFCGLTAAVMALIGTLALKGDVLRGYLYALGGAVVLFLPHLPVTLHQLSMGGVPWVGVPEEDWPLEHLHHVMNGSWAVLGILAAVGLVGWVFFRPRRNWMQWLLPLLLFAVPLLVGFFYSRHVSPVLQHSVLLFSFPFLLMFLFSGWDDSRPWFTSAGVAVVLGAGVFSTVSQRDFFGKEHFGVFRELANRAVKWQMEYGDGLLLVADVNHPSYLDRYLDRTENPGLRFHQYRVSEGDGLIRLKELMADTSRTHLAYAWSTINQPLEVERIICEGFPVEVEAELHFNSGVRLFRRGAPIQRVISEFTFGNDDGWQCDTARVAVDSLGNRWFMLNSEHPYGPAFFAPIEGLSGELTVFIEASLPDTLAEFLLVFEQWSGDERYVWESRSLHAQIRQGGTGWAVADIDISPAQKENDALKVYGWTVNGVPIRVLRMEVRER
jgi:hypothetical protein